MNKERSSQVMNRYRQEKLNASVLAQMKRILVPGEREREIERRYNLTAIIAVLTVVAVGIYLFSRLTIVTI